MNQQAAIIAIGDELALGQTVDTNSAWLSEQLTALGVMPRIHLTVADDLQAIVSALDFAHRQADWVIVSGGLGPTDDDLTRQALAQFLDQPLQTDRQALAQVERFFATRRYPMPDGNRRQAEHPAGTCMLDNPHGTAPGIQAAHGSARLFVMPGVPHEMKQMFQRHVKPQLLEQNHGRVIRTMTLHSFGMGESMVNQMLGELISRDRNPTVGTTVSRGLVSLRLRSDFPTAEQAETALLTTAEQIRERMGELIFGADDQTLEQMVGRLLSSNGYTLATAESCTGGWIGKMLTDIPGSSAWYRGGWVVYSNALKSSQLQVPDDILQSHGAVSEPVARQLALSACLKADTDLAVAVTGIAGPDGGSDLKPVGTVWIALAQRLGKEPVVEAVEYHFPGSREAVRRRTALTALDWVRRKIRAVAE